MGLFSRNKIIVEWYYYCSFCTNKKKIKIRGEKRPTPPICPAKKGHGTMTFNYAEVYKGKKS